MTPVEVCMRMPLPIAVRTVHLLCGCMAAAWLHGCCKNHSLGSEFELQLDSSSTELRTLGLMP